MSIASDLDLHPAIGHVVARLQEMPAVQRVLLFGSRARGDHDPRADIDLAVDCPGAGFEDWARIWAVVDDAPTLLPIDLVRLDEADPPLRATIEQEGLVLHDRRQD